MKRSIDRLFGVECCCSKCNSLSATFILHWEGVTLQMQLCLFWECEVVHSQYLFLQFRLNNLQGKVVQELMMVWVKVEKEDSIRMEKYVSNDMTSHVAFWCFGVAFHVKLNIE